MAKKDTFVESAGSVIRISVEGGADLLVCKRKSGGVKVYMAAEGVSIEMMLGEYATAALADWLTKAGAQVAAQAQGVDNG